MYAYLTMTSGNRAGTSFPLDARLENRIGRGTDCAITVSDPLCSRVHAIVFRDADQWCVRDADSRNGTMVNGAKVEQAPLSDGHNVRIGSTEFAFRNALQPPSTKIGADPTMTQTIVKEMPIIPREIGHLVFDAIQKFGVRSAQFNHSRGALLTVQGNQFVEYAFLIHSN